MKKIIASVAFLVCASFSVTAFAQAAPKGFYLGAGVGNGWSNVLDDVPASGAGYTTSVTDSDVAWKLYGGYDFGQGFGLELGYYNLGTNTLNFSTAGFTSQDDFVGQAFAASATFAGAFGKSEWFWAAKLGAAWTKGQYECKSACVGVSDTTEDGIGLIYGLGAGYNITENFAIRADWEGITTVKYNYLGSEIEGDYNLFTVSAQFRF